MSSLLGLLFNGYDITLSHVQWRAVTFRVSRILEQNLIFICMGSRRLVNNAFVKTTGSGIKSHYWKKKF
jgi:hypothetical protein